MPFETFAPVDPRSRSKVKVRQALHVVPGQQSGFILRCSVYHDVHILFYF